MENIKSKKRLSKYMAEAGVASRRACEEIIFAGRVQVNGKVTLLPQTMVDDSDKIKINNKLLAKPASKVYYILNKPVGYLCTAAPYCQKRILDLFTGCKERLFTIGRLDKDTSGLLLVTNDGEFAQKVIHPSSNIQKEYIAKTDCEINTDHLTAISTGGLVEGIFVKPHKVVKVRKGTVKVVIKEGKKREVRLLLENAGLQVLELKRTRVGNLKLGTLPIGTWRALTEREKEQIFE